MPVTTELNFACDDSHAVASQSTNALLSQWEIWYFIQSLLGNIGGLSSGKWTVYQSCDHAAYGTANDGVDRWTSSFDATKIVQASSGAHSWFVLKSPSGLGKSGSVYMIVDYLGSSTNQVFISFCTTAPTTGSTTQAPSSPTANDTWNGSSPVTLNNGNHTPQHFVHMHLAPRGDFHFYESYTGGGQFDTILSLTKLMDPHPGDLYPVVALVVQSGQVNGVAGLWSYNAGVASTTSNSTMIAGKDNTLLRGRNFDGSATPKYIVPAFGIVTGRYQNYSGTLLGPDYCGILDPVLMSLEQTNASGANESDATYNSPPCYVVSIDPHTEWKGRLADVKWASGDLVQGTVTPPIAGGQTDYCGVKQGQMFLPWVAAIGPQW